MVLVLCVYFKEGGTIMDDAPESYFGKSQKTTWGSVRSLAQYPCLKVSPSVMSDSL